jgi:hypothetical protein
VCTLCNERDAVRTLSGVIRPLVGGMKTATVQGLPALYLNHFHLFSSSKGGLRRRDRFASFSWAGWQRDIMWPHENFERIEDSSDDTLRRARKSVDTLEYVQRCNFISWFSTDPSTHLMNLTCG